MKKFLVFAVGYTLFTSSPLNAVIILDDVMTKEEQKKTGVATLSRLQRLALETWLNENFQLKTQPQNTASSLSLSININNGQKLQLSDNSIWEVAPEDVPTAANWITPVLITLAPSKDPAYPTLLVNTMTGVSVKARIVSPNS